MGVTQLESKRSELAGKIEELVQREEGAGQVIEQCRSSYHGLLGDVELGASVDAGKMSRAKAAVEMAEDRLAGITTARAELSRRLSETETQLLAARKAATLAAVRASIADAQKVAAEIQNLHERAMNLLPGLRDAATAATEAGSAFARLAGHGPGVLPPLVLCDLRPDERLESARHAGACLWEEVRTNWSALGRAARGADRHDLSAGAIKTSADEEA